MKIAFATTDGITVDEHFGRAGRFEVYELNIEGYHHDGTRRFAEGRDSAVEDSRGRGVVHDDLVEGKVEKLRDCAIVYLTEIGGPSAARLARRGIMPVKLKAPESIADCLAKLHETITTAPPPWLKKALRA